MESLIRLCFQSSSECGRSSVVDKLVVVSRQSAVVVCGFSMNEMHSSVIFMDDLIRVVSWSIHQNRKEIEISELHEYLIVLRMSKLVLLLICTFKLCLPLRV